MLSFSKIIGGLLSATLLFTGCSDDSTTKSAVSVMKETKKEVKKVESKKFDKIDLSDILQDNAKIAANNKYMITIFDREDCEYCYKLRQDIIGDNNFKNRLKNDFSVYSVDVAKNTMHKLMHEGEYMDVDTNTMIDIYGITSTPTIIFSDKSTKSIFLVPGYMPKDQFMVTLDFIESGTWLDKDRKNGQVYEELKQFYISKGIDVSKGK